MLARSGALRASPTSSDPRPAAASGATRGPALATLFAAFFAAAAAAEPPVAVLPIFDGGGTDSFLQLDLGDGDGHLYDRLDRGRPSEIRRRFLEQNLFRQIGRPTDQPAIAGEFLLGPIVDSGGVSRAAFCVETTTGWVAILEDVGRGDELGKISTALGRPFEGLATQDGNYALLMRRDSSGRTDGAYLYHATTGRGRYYGGLRKLETAPPEVTVGPLPQLAGRVAAAPLLSREQTVGYLVLDGGNGDLYFLDLANDPSRIAARKSQLNLSEVFSEPGPHPTPQRFVAVPIEDDDEITRQLFVLDVSNGEIAVLSNLDPRGAAVPSYQKSPRKLYDVLREQPSEEPRVIATVPARAGNGEVEGLYLVDSRTRAVVYVDQPGSAAQLTLRRVSISP
jgi:hypothetical protein